MANKKAKEFEAIREAAKDEMVRFNQALQRGAGCNNDTWANLLQQVGVERHPRWRK